MRYRDISRLCLMPQMLRRPMMEAVNCRHRNDAGHEATAGGSRHRNEREGAEISTAHAHRFAEGRQDDDFADAQEESDGYTRGYWRFGAISQISARHFEISQADIFLACVFRRSAGRRRRRRRSEIWATADDFSTMTHEFSR